MCLRPRMCRQPLVIPAVLSWLLSCVLDSPQSPTSSLQHTHAQFLVTDSRCMSQVRDNFFPRLRSLLTAPEAKTLFNNWAELVPLSEVRVASASTRRVRLPATPVRLAVAVTRGLRLGAARTGGCGRNNGARADTRLC